MRYLPPASISDKFWKELGPRIQDRLSKQAVLRSWDRGILRRPSELVKLPPNMLDEDGQPLLREFEEVRYLSPAYADSDWPLLRQLGTRETDYDDFLKLLENDVYNAKTSQSRWENLENSHDWQKRVSKILLTMCDARQNGNHQDIYKTALQSFHCQA